MNPNDIRSCDESTKRTALVVSTLAGFLTPFMGSSMNVALPAIAAEFSMKAVSYGLGCRWLTCWPRPCPSSPFGRLGDIRGRKRIFILGLMVYMLSAVLAASSFSAAFLIALARP